MIHGFLRALKDIRIYYIFLVGDWMLRRRDKLKLGKSGVRLSALLTVGIISLVWLMWLY